MGLFDTAESLQRNLTPFIEKIIGEQTRECLRTYKAKVITPPNAQTGKCEVQLVGQDTTISLPFSTEASGVVRDQMVWVATTFNSFRNGVVLNSIDFRGSKRIGDIYISIDDISPASLFGGRWEKIEDCFLYTSGSISVGARGGSKKITKANLPSGITGKLNTYSLGNSYGIFPSSDLSGVFKADDGEAAAKNAAYPTGTQSTESSPHRGVIFNLGGEDEDYMPPYLAVNVWKRIKGDKD